MIFLANILGALADVISVLLNAAMLAVLIRVILTLIRTDPRHPLMILLHRLTEPILRVIRRIFPWSARAAGLDWSPLILWLVILFLSGALVDNLRDLAALLRS